MSTRIEDIKDPAQRAKFEAAAGINRAVVSQLTSDTGSPTKADRRAEKALQDEFERWLRLHGYMYRREPMHQATMAPAGHPDFTIYAAAGRTVFVEYKTATGRLSPVQTDYHRQL